MILCNETVKLEYSGFQNRKDVIELNIEQVQNNLITRTKRGVSMFYVGTGYWLLLGLLSFIDMHIKLLGLFYLIGAGMLFPLGILVSKMLKIDFVANGNPLSGLNGLLGATQLFFAPILVLIFMEKVEWLPFFVAILTGAHFFPFVWVYKSKAYIFQTVAVVLSATFCGFLFMDMIYSILPFILAAVYLTTSILLNAENKRNHNSSAPISTNANV